ncbi:CinA family protein [Cumulibacter soli]|uniref:CinA family protein n=1 Tax=Cumulibacter soli TaxID=2546344 RepID=UPI00106761C4|nr:CinA family protein [Cumulibacter soli]
MSELLTPSTQAIAAETIAALRDCAQSVGTAESLTAGLCAAALTTIPGASAVVRGGLIVYATALKASLAGVPEDVLSQYGPVSEPTARYLGAGAMQRTGSDWGVGLTGVAGPGSQDGHPPGTVYVAVHGAGSTVIELLRCHGDRGEIRDQAVAGALRLLLRRLREHHGPVLR